MVVELGLAALKATRATDGKVWTVEARAKQASQPENRSSRSKVSVKH